MVKFALAFLVAPTAVLFFAWLLFIVIACIKEVNQMDKDE